MDGSALRVLGRAVIKVTVELSRSVTTEVLIIENLTTDGILGMDFLQRNRRTIDIPGRKLTLTDGAIIPLYTKASTTYVVRLVETTTIPPRFEMEVTGKSSTLSPGLWFLEGHHFNGQSVVVARALMESRGTIPVRLLNTSNEDITLHRDTKVGNLHEIDEWQIGAVTATSAHHATDKVKQDRLLLWRNPIPAFQLSRKRILHAALLQQYADIFAAPGISWDALPSFGIT